MNDIFIGFYLGALFMVILYNIQWYFTSKKIAYLYYSLLQFFMILLIIQSYKIVFFDTSYLILTATLVIVFALLFSKEFLELKKYYKNINTFFNAFIICFLLFASYSLYYENYEIFKQTYSLLFFPFIPIAYLIYKKGFKPAIYYIFAWGIFVLSIFISDIVKIFEINELKNYPFSFIGNFLEALILSFALSYKTKLLIIEQKKQEQLLIQQSKLASIGQMINNISHQWRQPLNRIAAYIMNMQMHIMNNYKNDEVLLKKLEESQFQLEYISNTIDDFSNFYKKDNKKETFNISKTIFNCETIIDSTLKSNNISLKINIKEDMELTSYPRALSQVILNILQNANDALLENKIKDPKIEIILEKNILSISDNAKGINKDIIEKIFDAYFTTKESKNGSGIGLYMSKIILQNKFAASLNVKNTENGATFYIKF